MEVGGKLVGPQCPLLTDEHVPVATANAEPGSSPATLQVPSQVTCVCPQFLRGKHSSRSPFPMSGVSERKGATEEGKRKDSRCKAVRVLAHPSLPLAPNCPQ